MGMSSEIRENIKSRNVWMRALYMVLFAVIYSIAEFVVVAVVLLQFLFTLFTARQNDRLLLLGQSLSTYLYQILLYLTYNTEYMTFPFGDWPSGPPATPPHVGNAADRTIDT
jgi:hypothetical protein